MMPQPRPLCRVSALPLWVTLVGVGVFRLAQDHRAARLFAEAARVHRASEAAQSPELERAHLRAAHARYRDYFARHPRGHHLGEAAFYDGEALYALGRFAEAAASYTRALTIDPRGPHHRDAAYARLLATLQTIEGDEGEAPPGCRRDCPLSTGDAARLDAYEAYLRAVERSSDRPIVAYRRARLELAWNHLDAAARHFAALVEETPNHALAIVSAHLLLDCYVHLQRPGAYRAAAARLERSPAMRDAGLRARVVAARGGSAR